MIRTRRHRKPSSAVCSQTLPIPAPTLRTCRGCQLGLLSKNRGTSKPCGPLPRLPASVSPPTLRSSLRGPKYPGVHRPPAQARENQAEMLGRRLAGKAGRAVHHPQPSPLSTMTFSEPKPRSPPPRPCRWLRPCHCAPEGSSPPPSRTHLGGGPPLRKTRLCVDRGLPLLAAACNDHGRQSREATLRTTVGPGAHRPEGERCGAEKAGVLHPPYQGRCWLWQAEAALAEQAGPGLPQGTGSLIPTSPNHWEGN